MPWQGLLTEIQRRQREELESKLKRQPPALRIAALSVAKVTDRWSRRRKEAAGGPARLVALVPHPVAGWRARIWGKRTEGIDGAIGQALFREQATPLCQDVHLWARSS
jgi:hypothetical protein